MKNFGIFSLIILLSSVSKADNIESGYRKIAEAWMKQTGVEIELANSGNYIYETYIKENYRTPLAVSAQIAEAIHAGRIQINVRWDF